MMPMAFADGLPYEEGAGVPPCGLSHNGQVEQQYPWVLVFVGQVNPKAPFPLPPLGLERLESIAQPRPRARPQQLLRQQLHGMPGITASGNTFM